MKCTEIGEQLMDAAAGLEVEPQVAEHLRSCAGCTERLESLQRTMTLLDEWQAPEPSPYFDSRLGARLREQEAQPRSWLIWLRKPALAAAMALLLTIGSLLYTGRGHEELSQAQPPGTPVGDLQVLDRNHDIFTNFDLLDDLSPDEGHTANP
jgi:anti-sigma factor RsiW